MDKNKQEGLTRKEVAQRFGVSVSAVRSWQRQFASWLEVEKQQAGGGSRHATRYSEADMLVFATVQRLTSAGMNYDEVREALDDELTKTTLPPPTEGTDEDEPGTALVSWQQYASVVAQLQGTEGKLEATEGERDWLRDHVGKLEDRVDELQQKAWLDAAQSKQLSKLEARLNEVEQELEEESQKSWWQRLRGR